MADGCYTDLYLPASFKGVPFEALESDSQHGRRGAEGEFPFGEDTAYADLGRSIRRYNLSGRLTTNDHIAIAAALIFAVESPGPGILIHPTRGPLFVACKSLRVRDNPIEEQGVSYIDMEFVEANIFGNGFAFGQSLLGLVLTPLVDMFVESFDENYQPENTTFYDRAATLQTSQIAVSSLSSAFQQSTAELSDIKVYRIIASFQTLSSDSGLLSDKDTMREAMVNGFALVDKYASFGVKKQELLRAVVNANTYELVVGSTAKETVNAVQAFMRSVGSGYLARAYLESEPRDMNEAFTQYDIVITALTQELGIALSRCDTRLHLKLGAFIEQVKAQLLARAYNSPALVKYDFNGPVNSLTAAYAIHDDASRFGELEQRNPYSFPWALGPDIVAVSE